MSDALAATRQVSKQVTWHVWQWENYGMIGPGFRRFALHDYQIYCTVL